MNNHAAVLLLIFFVGLGWLFASHSGAASGLSAQQLEQLGEQIFFDPSLSSPVGQSCASCHNPAFAYADKGNVTSAGAKRTLSANRNAPSLSYSNYTPKWHYNNEDETWIGGFFADGRSLTLEQQALEPLFSPLEMAVESPMELSQKLKATGYGPTIEKWLGNTIWQQPERLTATVASALSAFQRSDRFTARFSSKYDAYLRGEAELSDAEARGLKLYEAEDKGNCAACHPNQIGPKGEWPLFTDFSYDNLGIPKNNDLAFLHMAKKYNPEGRRYVDPGLAGNPEITDKEAELGKFKVPTLRNIVNTGPYMHNGFFTDLRESVVFYNKRNSTQKWSTPEIYQNVNQDELGDLKLTDKEVDDIVSFLHTLNDNWQNPLTTK